MSIRRPPPIGPNGLVPPPVPVTRAPSRSSSTLSVGHGAPSAPLTKPLDRVPVPQLPPSATSPERSKIPRATSAPRLPTPRELSPKKAVSFSTSSGRSGGLATDINPAFGPMVSVVHDSYQPQYQQQYYQQQQQRPIAPLSPNRDHLLPQALPPALAEAAPAPAAPSVRPATIARTVLDSYDLQQLQARSIPYSTVRRSGFVSPLRDEFRRSDPVARSQPSWTHENQEIRRFQYEPPPMLRDTYWEIERYAVQHVPGKYGMASDADANDLGLSNQYLRPADRWGSPSRDRTITHSVARNEGPPTAYVARRAGHSRPSGTVQEYDDERYETIRSSRRPDSRSETPVRDVTPRYRTRSGGRREVAEGDAVLEAARSHRRAREEIRGIRSEENTNRHVTRHSAAERESVPASPGGGWRRDYDFTQRSHRSRRQEEVLSDDRDGESRHRRHHHHHRHREGSEEYPVAGNEVPDSYVVGARQKFVVPVRDDTPTRRSSRHDEISRPERDVSRSRRREGEDEEEYRARRRAEKELRRQRHGGAQ